MRQHKLFETQPVFGIQIVQRLSPISDASYVKNFLRRELDEWRFYSRRWFSSYAHAKGDKNADEFGITESLPQSG